MSDHNSTLLDIFCKLAKEPDQTVVFSQAYRAELPFNQYRYVRETYPDLPVLPAFKDPGVYRYDWFSIEKEGADRYRLLSHRAITYLTKDGAKVLCSYDPVAVKMAGIDVETSYGQEGVMIRLKDLEGVYASHPDYSESDVPLLSPINPEDLLPKVSPLGLVI